jgi:hypothetical protein
MKLGDEQVEPALDDDGEIAGRVGVTHQIPGQLELFLEGMTGVELQAIAVGREWFERAGRSGGDRTGCGGELANVAASVGSGCARREKLQDLEFRFAAHGLQELVVVLGREVVAEEREGSEKQDVCVTHFDRSK